MKVAFNGRVIEARGFLWDHCHKIYLIRDDADLDSMRAAGWDDPVLALSELPAAWENTCPLRFISSGDLSEHFVGQGEDAVIELVD